MFGHTINNSGFKGGSTGVPFFWLYVLPLGFLLTMYTITGYDASAHVSEETHGADESAPKGIWRSVFYSAVIGWIVLLAITFAIQKQPGVDDPQGGLPGARDLRDSAQLGGRQSRDPDLDRRPAVLRDGVRDERLADDVRVLARRRDSGP